MKLPCKSVLFFQSNNSFVKVCPLLLINFFGDQVWKDKSRTPKTNEERMGWIKWANWNTASEVPNLKQMIALKDWTGVVAILRSDRGKSDAKRLDSEFRCLPLHWACIQNAPDVVIDALLKAYPKGVSRKAGDGSLPLHCACMYSTRIQMVRIIISCYPQAVNEWDNVGRLPLHIACHRKDLSEESLLYLVKILVNESPDSVYAADMQGNLAYNYAMKSHLSQEFMNCLLNIVPDTNLDL